MTLQLADQAVLRAFQSRLKAVIQAPVGANRQAQHVTRLEVLWTEMTVAGDLLIEALRLEQEFSEIDVTQTEGEALERWRLDRNTVERIAEDYAMAVANWRDALQVECRASARCDFD